MSQLARLVVNAIALWVTVAVVPDLDWKDESNFVNILVLALVFGAINSYLKPVLKLLSLPVRLVTFGLFGLVLNAALFLLLAWVGDQFDLGFSIAGWPAEGFTLDVLVAAVIGAIVLSVVSTVLSFLVGRAWGGAPGRRCPGTGSCRAVRGGARGDARLSLRPAAPARRRAGRGVGVPGPMATPLRPESERPSAAH